MANTNREAGSKEAYMARILRNKKKIIEKENQEREENSKTVWGKRKNLELDLDMQTSNPLWENDASNSQRKMTTMSDEEHKKLGEQYTNYKAFQKNRILNNPNLYKGTSYRVMGMSQGYSDAYENNFLVASNTSTNETGHVFDTDGIGKMKKDGKWVTSGGRFIPTSVTNNEGETIGYDYHAWKSADPKEWEIWNNEKNSVKKKYGMENFYTDITGSKFKSYLAEEKKGN